DPDRPRPFRVPSGLKWTLLLYAGFAVALLFPKSGRPTIEQLLAELSVGKLVALIIALAIFLVSRNHIFAVLGVLSCLYLIYYLPPTSWLRFAAWLNFGFVIYVGYGSVNSRLTGRRDADHQQAHDAHTAYTGAILAVIGAALLFFMRAFDVFLA